MCNPHIEEDCDGGGGGGGGGVGDKSCQRMVPMQKAIVVSRIK